MKVIYNKLSFAKQYACFKWPNKQSRMSRDYEFDNYYQAILCAGIEYPLHVSRKYRKTIKVKNGGLHKKLK